VSWNRREGRGTQRRTCQKGRGEGEKRRLNGGMGETHKIAQRSHIVRGKEEKGY